MYKLLITDLDDTLYSWTRFYIPAFYAMAEAVSDMTGIDLKRLLDEYRSVHQEKGTVEYPFATLYLPSIRDFYAGKTDPELLLQILDEEDLDRSDAIYAGDSLTKDILMAYDAGVTSIQCSYPSEANMTEYEQKLIRISSWTEEIFRKEAELRMRCEREQIRPDYIITDFRDIFDIICR